MGPEAFATTSPLLTFREELTDVVRWGVVDLIAALPDDPVLMGELVEGTSGSVNSPIADDESTA